MVINLKIRLQGYQSKHNYEINITNWKRQENGSDQHISFSGHLLV